MTHVRVLVCYGGVWDDKGRKYEGGLLKGVVVSKEITHNDLVVEIYALTEVDPEEFNIKMRCIYGIKSENHIPPFEISNDRDLKFYLMGENLFEVPLYISFEPRNKDFTSAKDLHVEGNKSIAGSNKVKNTTVSIPVHATLDNLVQVGLGDAINESSTWESHDLKEDNFAMEFDEAKNFTYESYDIPQERSTSKYCKRKGVVECQSSSQRTCMNTNIWSEGSSTNDELEVGQIFFGKKDLSMKLSVMAMKKNFEFRVKKSTTEILYVRCVDDNCKWRLRAVKLKGSDIFKISKYVNVHSCSLDILNHDHRQAKSWVVGEIIKSKFKGIGRQYKPRDIIEDMRQDYGINMSYEKAWRARESAYMRVRGSPKESYNLLRRYGEALKLANPDERMMNSAAEAGRRLCEGFGDGRFHTNNEKWKLFLVVVAALLASLVVQSNASEGIGEWQILTRQNFSSQIRLHPHILLLVTLPWSGESRALMKDIAHLIENRKESYSSLKLMFMYRNSEKMLVNAIGASSEETNVIFYHHSVSYKYQGRLTAQNIVFSIYPYMSLLPKELPLTHLNTPEDLKSFLDSTDKALLLMEFCGWTPKLLSKGIKSNVTDDLVGTTDEHTDGIQTSRGKNNIKHRNKNTDMMCSIEKGYDGVPWIGEFSSGNDTSCKETKCTNQSFPLSCNIEEFMRYNSFFTNLLAVVREFFLPREKHGFGLISDRLMLSSLGIEDSDSWFVALHFAGCPRCSKILRADDDLKQNLQMNNFIVSELEVDGSGQQPALPVNKPSVILFVDRSSNSSESRRESKVALVDFRELAQQYCTSYPVTEQGGDKLEKPLLQRYPIMRSALEPPSLKLSTASQLIKLEDKMSSFMVVNEGKLVSLDKLASELQGNSLHEILSLLQKKEAKLSSLARNLGLQLLSDDIDIKLANPLPEVAEVQPLEVSPETSQEGTMTHSVQPDEDQSNNGRCVSAKEHMEASEFCTIEASPEQDNEKRASIHTVEHNDFIQSDESAAHQKLDVAQNIKAEEKSSLTMETSRDENLRFQGFEGSFFFSDGNYRLLKALTGQSKFPALVIVDPLLQQHHVFPQEKILSYSSQADFLSSFINRSLLPYQLSESVNKSPRAAISPPFVNLDFHEVDSVPRVTALTFSKLVIGSNQSESLNTLDAYGMDVLVLFSNSWCGFCQRTEVVVREVYRAIQGYANMLKSGCAKEHHILSETRTDLLSKLPLIYLMDCTLNDCSPILQSIDQREVYPALLLFPASRKTAILYRGALAVSNIIKFVAEQGSNSQHLINQKGILRTVAENRIGRVKSFDDARPTHLQEKDPVPKEKYHEVLVRDRKVESATRFSHINLHITNDEDESAPHISVGSMLIATDKLVGSQLFDNSQILIVKADQTIGFHGLIINKLIRWDSLQDLGEGLDMLNEAPLSLGGPLIKRKMPLLALTQRVPKDLHTKILPGIYFLDQVATLHEIEEIKSGNNSVTGYWFFLGYSSWSWDQLYDEIAEGAWRLSDDSTNYLDWPEV